METPLGLDLREATAPPQNMFYDIPLMYPLVQEIQISLEYTY